MSTYTSVGIGIAIAGNVLISLALNIQKRAHRDITDRRHGQSPTLSGTSSPTRQAPSSLRLILDDDHHELAEQRPLLPTSSSSSRLYGAATAKSSSFTRTRSIPHLPQAANGDRGHEPEHDDDDDDELDEGSKGTESDYLRSKLWHVALPSPSKTMPPLTVSS